MLVLGEDGRPSQCECLFQRGFALVPREAHLAILSSCPASMLRRLVVRDKGGGAIWESRLLVLLFFGSETLSEAKRRTCGCVGLESSVGEPGGVSLSAKKSMCIER